MIIFFSDTDKSIKMRNDNTKHQTEGISNWCLAPNQPASENNLSRPCFHYGHTHQDKTESFPKGSHPS